MGRRDSLHPLLTHGGREVYETSSTCSRRPGVVVHVILALHRVILRESDVRLRRKESKNLRILVQVTEKCRRPEERCLGA